MTSSDEFTAVFLNFYLSFVATLWHYYTFLFPRKTCNPFWKTLEHFKNIHWISEVKVRKRQRIMPIDIMLSVYEFSAVTSLEVYVDVLSSFQLSFETWILGMLKRIQIRSSKGSLYIASTQIAFFKPCTCPLSIRPRCKNQEMRRNIVTLVGSYIVLQELLFILSRRLAPV